VAITFATAVCNWCSRTRPRSRVHALQSGQSICDYCLDWHFHAMDFLGGAVPRGCQGCNSPWDALQARTPGDAVRMYVVPKDGINQMLCHSCTLAYAAKRPDLYKNTKFWTELEAETA
jgi:hypothetical protein